LLGCNHLCTLLYKQRNRQSEKGATVMELIEAADLDDVVIQKFFGLNVNIQPTA
jgi:hypothetical protein